LWIYKACLYLRLVLGGHVPDLGALQLLAAIADTGSVNAAARICGVSQQAASQRVSAIESQTGLSLVQRGPRGSSLTADGRLVVGWADKVLEGAAALDSGIEALRGGRSERLRVAASLTVAEYLLPAWLIALAGGEPTHVALHTTNSAAVIAALREGEADLGFVETTDLPPAVRRAAVGGDRLVAVVGRSHPWARRTTPVPGRLLASTPLVSREGGSGTRTAYVAAIHRDLGAEIEVAEPTIVLDTATAIRSAVAAGTAPAVLSELAVADDLRTGRLVRVRIRDLDLRRRFHAVWMGAERPPVGLARQLVGLAQAAVDQ
jgi:molybdate transport repressor ModE-like protein